MSLTNVWMQTWADGLVRADQIVGIDAHRTPAVAGKPSHWLVDAVLGAPVGFGTPEQWDVTVLHRTLIQTGYEPREAPVALARLLAQLDLVSVAGVITVSVEPSQHEPSRIEPSRTTSPAQVAAAAAEPSGDLLDERADPATGQSRARFGETGAGSVRFRFTPFAHPEPGHHTDPEYL